MNALLDKIADQSAALNIQAMTDVIAKQLDPIQIYLFGSFATGNYTDKSDYDLYIVVDDGADLWNTTAKARKAVRDIKSRPVDIVVGTTSRFHELGNATESFHVEGEVFRHGMLLYDHGIQAGAQ